MLTCGSASSISLGQLLTISHYTVDIPTHLSDFVIVYLVTLPPTV